MSLRCSLFHWPWQASARQGFFIVFLSLFTATQLVSQNLVPNPSFEDNFICDYQLFNVQIQDFLTPWLAPNFSSDYFHACANLNSGLSVPCNDVSYQSPHSGLAYIGLIISDASNPVLSYKENIEAPLIQVLEADSFYNTFCYINVAEVTTVVSNINFAILFTDTLVITTINFDTTLQSGQLIEANPQLVTPLDFFLTDTANWKKVEWMYQAKGGEQFITLGNFQEDELFEKIDTLVETLSLCDIVNLDYNAVYLLLDDVSVTQVTSDLLLIRQQDYVVCDSILTDTLTVSEYYDSVTWSTGDTTRSTIITSPGVYWVEGVKGFSKIRDSITIHLIASNSLTLGGDTVVCSQSFPIVLSVPYYLTSYQWSTGSDTYSTTIFDQGEYYIFATHACGTWNDTIKIDASIDVLNIGNDTILCDMPIFNILLSAPLGFDNYQWSTSVMTSQTLVTSPGSYSLQATNECGILSDTIEIINIPPISLSIGNNLFLCVDSTVTLTANSGFDKYLWSTGATTQSIDIITPNQYICFASNTCETVSDSIEISTAPSLILTLTQDTTISLGDTIQLELSSSDSFLIGLSWSPAFINGCNACLSQFISPTTTTTYSASATNQYYCGAEAQITVSVFNIERIFIPNAFTPDSDGVNDFFEVFTGPEATQPPSMQIFDRWGNLIFESQNNTQTKWDGIFRDRQLPTGTYAYFIQVKFIDGTTKQYSGSVELLR